MNVVIVNDNAQINGGAAKIAIMEAVGLAERGHRVFFVCAILPIDRALLHPGIEVVCSEQDDLISNPSRVAAFIQGWWNVKSHRMMEDLVGRLDRRETVVHLHIWGRALSSSVPRASILARMPTICTLHDFTLACPTGTFFLHPEQDICRLRPLSMECVACNCDTRSYPQKLWRVGRQLIQEQFGHIPNAISDFIVHSTLAHEIMKPYLPPGSTVHLLTAYIESRRLAPATPGENESFVYLGRLVREKGVSLLARCAEAEGVPLLFVGSGPLEADLKSIYPEASVTGWVDHAAMVKHLRGARGLIFPSLWFETLGLVVLEAAANGIPSIVSDTSAARELVIDGVTGLHFKRGDEGDLRRKMRRLQDRGFASALGAAAYDKFWASDYPSRETHISSLEGIYRTMLRRRHIL